MPRIGPTELVIILFIILIIFGAGRLPEIGSALGRGIREFRKGQSGENAGEDPEPAPDPAKRGRRKRKEEA
ncbi:MAG: twin-arginine translocase TatA/TatE family subunit [Chloroflexi bacterium]|nr:twin-arginine translocase TatA/TatE family subunit [Chloroflexota bacterium]